MDVNAKSWIITVHVACHDMRCDGFRRDSQESRWRSSQPDQGRFAVHSAFTRVDRAFMR